MNLTLSVKCESYLRNKAKASVCLHLQGEARSSETSVSFHITRGGQNPGDQWYLQKMGPHSPPKRWYPTTSLHGLKMEAAWSSETARRHNPGDRDFTISRQPSNSQS